MSDEIITIDTTKGILTTPPTPRVQSFTDIKCSGYGLGELIKNMKNPIGLEIGSDIGDTSEFLLKSNEKLFLHSIDPYENYVDWNGRDLNERESMAAKGITTRCRIICATASQCILCAASARCSI